MKVVGINPNWNLTEDGNPTDTSKPPKTFPIEWGYIEKHSRSFDKFGFEFFDLYRDRTAFAALKERLSYADFVIVSTAPSYLYWRCPPLDLSPVHATVLHVRKNSNACIILIGPHGTVLPKSTYEETGVDGVFRGEPDKSLIAELMRLHEGTKSPFIFSDECSDACVCPENSTLSEIAYTEDAVRGYEPHCWIPGAIGTERAVIAETSRGCSFDCPFCLRSGFRRKLRTKSLALFRDEVSRLVDLNVEYIFLIDENFGLPLQHCDGVLKILSERGLKFGLQTRPDIWTKERIIRLKDAGCVYVEIGMEATNHQDIRRLEKFSRPEYASEMLHLFENHIPHVGVNCFDTRNPDLKVGQDNSVVLDKYGDPANPFIPYPGTPWGDDALKKYTSNDVSWEQVRSLHSLYSLMSQKGPTARALRRSRVLRSWVHSWFFDRGPFKKLLPSNNGKTRHERLAAGRKK